MQEPLRSSGSHIDERGIRPPAAFAIEPLPAPEHGAELLEEPRHGREPKLEVRERDLGRLSCEHPQDSRQRLRILLGWAVGFVAAAMGRCPTMMRRDRL